MSSPTHTGNPASATGGLEFKLGVLQSDFIEASAETDTKIRGLEDRMGALESATLSGSTRVKTFGGDYGSIGSVTLFPLPGVDNRTERVVQIAQGVPLRTVVMDGQSGSGFVYATPYMAGPQSAARGPDVLGVAMIPLDQLLKVASVLTGFIGVASILLWLSTDALVLNPFVSLLSIVASPFLFGMGRAAGRR